MRLRILVVPAALACLLTLTACGGDKDEGVATAGGAAPTASASAALSKDEQGRKFAACMRENGVDMPDPEPGEAMRAELAKVDKTKLQAAMAACQSLLPGGGEGKLLDPQQVEQLRALAKCMRENGVEDFPEPDDTGKLRIEGNIAEMRESPQFKAAMEKCDDIFPNFKGGGGK
jgi:hypothetical protein